MKAALFACVLVLAGCDNSPIAQPMADQCVRPKLFEACMKLIPAGPVVTRNSDWAEVIVKCESSAYYQSLRKPSLIAPECRSQ